MTSPPHRWGKVVWRWGRKVQIGLSVRGPLFQSHGCFPSYNSTFKPRPPMPWMVRDLLSCKHIGSSIENGLTKSIKQTSFLVSRGQEGVVVAGGRGGGGQLAFPPFPNLPLWHWCLSFVCHVYVLFLLSLFWVPFFFFLTVCCTPRFSVSAFFLFHGFGSGRPEKWL